MLLPYAYPFLKAFPSVKDNTPQSLDDNRFARFHSTDLIELGVRVPAVGKPGGTPGIYSNTNYQVLCQLLERVTGMTAKKCITQNVIELAQTQRTVLVISFEEDRVRPRTTQDGDPWPWHVLGP